MRFDAEGFADGDICPDCGSVDTITYTYAEGFIELECQHCGYLSDKDSIEELIRFQGSLLEGKQCELPPIPIKKLEA